MGDYHNALSSEEHQKKIVQIVNPVLGNAQTEDLIATMLNQENLGKVEVKQFFEDLGR